MAFTKKTWVETNPITAAELNRVETGVDDAHAGAIDALAIGTTVIADAAVTNAKIASGVDASKLTTGTLPIARIANGAVTPAKTSFLKQTITNEQLVFLSLITGSATNNGPAVTSGWGSITTPGAGQVTVTHNAGSTNYVVVATAQGAPTSSVSVAHVSKAANTFTITTNLYADAQKERFNLPVEVFFFRFA